MSNESDVTSTISHAYGVMTVVDTALRLGVLDRLNRGPATVSEIATELSLDTHALEVLLRALAALGVIERTNRIVGDGDAASQGYRAAYTKVDMSRQWSGLEDRLRHGRSQRRLDTPEEAAAYYPHSVGALGEMMGPPAAVAAKHLEAQSPSAILDLCAGAAPWTRALSGRLPSSRVTAVDLAPVLEVTRAAATASGVENQYRFVPGDVFSVDLEDAHYDLCVLGMICHLFDGPTNRRLIARAARALKPGGVLAIFDTLAEHPDPLAVALYELDLLLRTTDGGIHALAAYSSWLRDEGFTAPPERLELGDQITLLTAHKPRPTA